LLLSAVIAYRPIYELQFVALPYWRHGSSPEFAAWREPTNHPDTEHALAAVPDSLWTKRPYDVGCVQHHQVNVKIRNHQVPVWRPQYRLKNEQLSGIQDTIKGLLMAGVLRPTRSNWNTPLLPVPKAENKGWRIHCSSLP